MKELNEETYDTEFDKLNYQMLKETKNTDNQINESETTSTKVVFTNGNTYTYVQADKAVYLNDNVKIAEKIDKCTFGVTTASNQKFLVTNVKIGKATRSSKYVLYYSLPKMAGKRVTENTEYIDNNGDTAIIPKGFTISGIDGEQTISTGLVIYDIPEEDIDTITWNPTVKTLYNQFVWIPVARTEGDTASNIAKFCRSDWSYTSDGGTRLYELSSKYTEPYSYDDKNYDATTGTAIASQIDELKKSIYNNKGFFIARYEAGSTTERTSTSGDTELVFRQDAYPYNYVQWGAGMGDVTTANSNGAHGAVYLSNNAYKNANYGVKSMLCTGAAWDTMLDFIKSEAHNVTNGTAWGNHSNSDFTVQRGKYAVYDSGLGNFQSVSGTYTKASDTKVLLTTGATNRNCAKNLYDIAGNCWEWTTEAYNEGKNNTEGRFYRGCSYWHGGTTPPTYRAEELSVTAVNESMGFRPILYITQPLPTDYQQVSYLESTGTQYLDTGHIVNKADNFTINLEAQFPTESRSDVYFGANGYGQFKITNTYNIQSSSTKTVGNKDTIIINYSSSNTTERLIVNGTTVETVSWSSYSGVNVKVGLFRLGDVNNTWFTGTSNYAKGKIYYCKIYDNDLLIRDLVPCYRKSDNKPGLYDIVNNVFYTNAGTGEFAVGPNV